jgi:hypothetical protein
MARISEDLRLPMINRHHAHWGQVNGALPNPLLIAGTFGIADLEGLRDDYVTLATAISSLRDTGLPVRRAERDGTWGLTPEDHAGVWSKLRSYRPLAKALLGARHPLARVIPNFSSVTPGNYVMIAKSFADHWTQVNAALGASPLVIGSLTLANLLTTITSLETTIREIDTDELLLSVKREQLEQLFGDEAEDVREATSIIARLSLYHAIVQAQFAGQPLGDSLPDIFPPSSPTTLPNFDFNWVVQPTGSVKVWYEAPNPAWNATQVFLKEGADSRTEAVNANRTVVWQDITIIDDLDEVEFRNADGLTVARGTRNTGLPEPA